MRGCLSPSNECCSGLLESWPLHRQSALDGCKIGKDGGVRSSRLGALSNPFVHDRAIVDNLPEGKRPRRNETREIGMINPSCTHIAVVYFMSTQYIKSFYSTPSALRTLAPHTSCRTTHHGRKPHQIWTLTVETFRKNVYQHAQLNMLPMWPQSEKRHTPGYGTFGSDRRQDWLTVCVQPGFKTELVSFLQIGCVHVRRVSFARMWYRKLYPQRPPRSFLDTERPCVETGSRINRLPRPMCKLGQLSAFFDIRQQVCIQRSKEKPASFRLVDRDRGCCFVMF